MCSSSAGMYSSSTTILIITIMSFLLLLTFISCSSQLEGVQPTTTPNDNLLAEQIIMADPQIRQLCSERYGITDPNLIVFDPWTLHGTPAGFEGRRLMQVRTTTKQNKNNNKITQLWSYAPLCSYAGGFK